MSVQMAEWRAKGYVPDSDDEDESQETLPANPVASVGAPETVDGYAQANDHGQHRENDGQKEAPDIPHAGEWHGNGNGGGLHNIAVDENGTENREKETTKAFDDVHTNDKSKAITDGYGITKKAFEEDPDMDELQYDHYAATPAAQLQTELLAGACDEPDRLQLVDSSPKAVVPDQSPLSSPLSEISSSSLMEQSLLDSATIHDGPPYAAFGLSSSAQPFTLNPAVECNIEPTDDLPGNYGQIEILRPARSLRHRNPIQLHPYAIEGESYRRFLHARGLKPLHIPREDAAATSRLRDDSRKVEFADEDTNVDMSSSPRLAESSGSQNLPADFFAPGGDDFPDMNALLRRPAREFTADGYKRRRINTPAFRRPATIPLVRQATLLQDSIELPDVGDTGVFDVPPSPPNSGSRSPLGVRGTGIPKFRRPRIFPSPALPTPLTSSEPRRRRPLEISEGQSSDNNSHAETTSGDTSESGDPPSEDETVQQLERVQRKIRGVLPASWLKLDLKTRAKKPAEDLRAYPSISPERKSMQRGVARPIVKTGRGAPSRSPIRHEAVLFSDEDESGSAKDTLTPRPILERHTGYKEADNESVDTGRCGEAMEDDRVDAMLPSATRKSFQSRKKRKRQKKMVDFVLHSRSIASDPNNLTRSEPARQPNITAHFDRGHKMKPKFRPPRLGILDAPAMASPERDHMPRFMKIASRTARTRSDKGRHSPSRKYLRLASRQDTDDMHETLQAWREGSIMSRPIESFGTDIVRRPLYPRSANTMASPKRPQPFKSRHFSRNTNTFRRKGCPARPSMLQSSVDKFVQRQPEDRLASDRHLESSASDALHRKDGPKRRGHIESTVQNVNDARPAMLESLQQDEDRMHSRTAFQRSLHNISRLNDDSSIQRPAWNRFFEDDIEGPSDHGPGNSRNSESGEATGRTYIPKEPIRDKRVRKRLPRRVDITAHLSGPSRSPVNVDISDDEFSTAPISAPSNNNSILGLGPFGTRYSTTMEIVPLPSGTCFHESTFLGSGDFKRSLNGVARADFDTIRRFAVIKCQQKIFRWGPWNETVSSELGDVVDGIKSTIQLSRQDEVFESSVVEHAILMHKSIIRFVAENLSFLDPVDRISFLQRCKGLISAISTELDDQSQTPGTPSTTRLGGPRMEFDIQLDTFNLVIANQLRLISVHELVPSQVREELVSLVMTNAKRTITAAGSCFDSFTRCLSKHDPDSTEHSLRENHHPVEALVVARHILDQSSSDFLKVWEIVRKGFPISSKTGVLDVTSYERCWRQTFTVLPFLEFDDQGVLETGRRFKTPTDNWTLVKQLISPILEAYITNPKGQAPSFNAYCRALFNRCLHLINGWGWRRCDSIIGTLFDFFARNNLSHLRNEESHGSPVFLEHLDIDPSMTAEPEDRCFHVLLKIIGSGLRHMRQMYPEKKIRDIVWRLMPNHGRSHPKEEAIRQEDLDALRNHHDLLCTLYWASPPGFRPKISAIRNLVHLESSHREACHINIRAWSNLVKFQLSTDEPLGNLEPFVAWHEDVLQQILRQHNLARTEAEAQVSSVQHVGGLAISRTVLESTIAKNQRQVEAILGDALVSLKLAVSAAQTKASAGALLSPALIGVFDLFDEGRPQATTVIIQALDVLSTYATKCSGSDEQIKSRGENDDSQDYGDWSAFNGDTPDDQPSQFSVSEPLQNIQRFLRKLLSSCFGADVVPSDALLTKLVDVWVTVGRVFVDDGVRSWHDYVGQFGNDSWNSLRNTEQTRKFEVYYLASLLKKDSRIYQDNRASFLTSWIGSLVERESLLKFQHKLTSALLDADRNEPLLANLPFWTSTQSGNYDVTVAEFAERRLSLISSLLSNMRVAVENAIFDGSVDASECKQAYKDLLRHLMTQMKQNYQELGHGSNVKGAYVDFVHRVIEFLQQHTSNICPIDRFFTDNAAFPLPATDPTYVVGQLKNYGLRLQDSRTPKQLAVFLQSVSERAAVDGQQAYLVDQLQTAMSNTFENASTRPTLRSFLVKAIIPAYVEMAFETPCGWILALPFLQALQRVFERLFVDLDGFNKSSVASVASIITAFLGCLRITVTSILDRAGSLKRAPTVRIISACYSAITALMPTLDYLVRLNGSTEHAEGGICFFQSFAKYLDCSLSQREHAEIPDVDTVLGHPTEHLYPEVRTFATQELRNTLHKNWIFQNGEYFVTRGASRRQVVVDIGFYEEERDKLSQTLQQFSQCLDVMPTFTQGRGKALLERESRLDYLGGLFF